MREMTGLSKSAYLKRYGAKNALIRILYTGWPVHVIKDYEIKKLLYYRKVYKWLVRKYSYAATVESGNLYFPMENIGDKVWVYWKQGISGMPPIVRKCISSIEKYSNCDVIILDDKNFSNYVQFPNYIHDKLEKGNLSIPAFSDLLRFALLEHYGGTWIDATVLLTNYIPEYVKNVELFLFRYSFGPIDNPALEESWFIHSKPHHPLLKEVLNMSLEYWKYENYVKEYLLPYILFHVAIHRTKENTTLWNRTPYAIGTYSELLRNCLGEMFDANKFEYIKTLTFAHKLTYRLDIGDVNQENTFYQYILKI